MNKILPKSVVTSKNQAKGMFKSKTHLNNNINKYKKWLNAIGDSEFLKDEYDPSTNYNVLLDDHYERLRRFKKSSVRIKSESVYRRKVKGTDKVSFDTKPKPYPISFLGVKITKLW